MDTGRGKDLLYQGNREKDLFWTDTNHAFAGYPGKNRSVLVTKMEKTGKFNLRFYFSALTEMVREPGKFFSDLPADIGVKRPLGFLLISGLIYAAAGLARSMPSDPILLGSILLVNAVGMTFITAGIGYMLMLMFVRKGVTFLSFFSVYAFSSGVVLLASWLPFFVWLTEPWKWWLIGTGMIKALGLRWTQAILILVVSFAIVALLFWSVLPIVLPRVG